VLIFTSGKWEAPTVAILATVQVFLLSMILGIYVFPELKIGSSPFLLLRDVMSEAPIFNAPNYLEQITGKGLNPLLQNYWMTIHPPTLFLGFSAVTIPFCFAVAGLWKKDFEGWLRPTLPWALFAAGILGTGIVMGGAWAYEALSFGGYWAWDPVENASLVPWLILVAGVHMNLIARSTGYSILGTYIFYALSFFFILYSTFLTRSGILGDSSVHAFTEMGLEWQLIIFMGTYVIINTVQFIKNRKKIPRPDKEEAFHAREFWMFIGALILLFSAGLIIFSTSIPVFNKIFDGIGILLGKDLSGLHRASPEDAMDHYNRFQIWIALFIGILTGLSQFLRFKEKRWDTYKTFFFKHLAIAGSLSILITILINQWLSIQSWQYLALLLSSVFAVICNGDYLISVLRTKLKSAAGTLAHIGFGLMIMGILASGLNQKYISNNAFAMQGIFAENDERLHKNVFLIRGRPMIMDDYVVTYSSDTIIRFDRKYTIQFVKFDPSSQDVLDSFSLQPYITYNQELTEMVNPNPDTKRYLNRDIFSHITSVPPEHQSSELARQIEDSLQYEQTTIRLGEPLLLDQAILFLDSIDLDPVHDVYIREPEDYVMGLHLTAWDSNSRESHYLNPVIAIKQNRFIYNYPAQVNDLRLRIRLTEESLDQILMLDQNIKFTSFRQKDGDAFEYNGYKITVSGFDRNPKLPAYSPMDGDIAVAVQLRIQSPEGKSGMSKPIFLIRDNRTYIVKDLQPGLGLSTRFVSIDPATGTLELEIGQIAVDSLTIPIEMAEDVPRNDYIVLEAIEFPGINLFWLGTSLMMLGMLLGMVRRMKLI
jgi:cytochrome c-type biogenesis protein CcmF